MESLYYSPTAQCMTVPTGHLRQQRAKPMLAEAHCQQLARRHPARLALSLRKLLNTSHSSPESCTFKARKGMAADLRVLEAVVQRQERRLQRCTGAGGLPAVVQVLLEVLGCKFCSLRPSVAVEDACMSQLMAQL